MLFIATQTKSQATLSIGAGMEFNDGSKGVQLRAGAKVWRSELSVGYTAFVNREDARFPVLVSLVYGLNILNGDLELLPLILFRRLFHKLFE